MFRRDPSSTLGWSQIGNALNGNLDNDFLGYSMDLSSDGSVLAVGAPSEPPRPGYVRLHNLLCIITTSPTPAPTTPKVSLDKDIFINSVCVLFIQCKKLTHRVLYYFNPKAYPK